MRRHPSRLAFLFLSLFLSAGFPTVSGAQQPDTLRLRAADAIRLALEVSPEVDAVQSAVEYAEARRRLAGASRFATDFSVQTAHAVAPGLRNLPDDVPSDELYLYPDVRNDWENIRPFNRIETNLIQPLLTWGEIGGSLDAARHGVDVERASVAQKENEVALRTGTVYYGLLLARQLSRLTDQARDVVDQARNEIERLLEEGAEDVDDADLFQVRITEQEFNRRVVEVEQRLMTVRTALRRQLMLPRSSVVVAEELVLEPIPFVLDSLDAYFDLALTHRPDLDRATAGLAAREALVRVARSDYYPKLFLGIESRITLTEGRFRQPNPYVSDPYRGRSLRAGLGLRLPLNIAQTRARVEQAEAERNEVRHQLTAARELVLFEVEEAYRNVITARAAMQAQEEALTISREWLRTEQINFDLDLGDTENLVDAVRASLELEASYYEQVRAYNVAVLTLLTRTGVLRDRARRGRIVD
ncbi:MAG: TolC family protein [Rhodothermales bacterium]